MRGAYRHAKISFLYFSGRGLDFLAPHELSPENALALAQAILTVHLGVMFFIIFGLVAIPLGGWLGWTFVYGFWWRLFHIIAISAVMAQKLLGDACFLTVWEYNLIDVARRAHDKMPSGHLWGDRLIHVDLPMSFFVTLYTVLWTYVVVLWFLVPARRSRAA
jgi:hypothetical protein